MSFSLSDFRRAAVSEPMKLVYSVLILLNHFSFVSPLFLISISILTLLTF